MINIFFLQYADHDASLRVKWENYMVGRSGKIVRCQELKTLIRQGIPHEYREEVWKGWVLFLLFLSLFNPLTHRGPF